MYVSYLKAKFSKGYINLIFTENTIKNRVSTGYPKI